jgi:hypothetical protein
LNEPFVTLGTCGLLEKEKKLNLNLFLFWTSFDLLFVSKDLSMAWSNCGSIYTDQGADRK